MPVTDIDLEQSVVRELEPGERLLWNGRPGQGIRFRRADWFMIPFSLMWAGFTVFWETGVVRSGAPVFMRIWGVPFLLVGIYLVVGRFIADAWTRRRTAYGVTDRRIIVISRLFTHRTTSHLLRSVPAITLAERRDGAGDIVLAAATMDHVGGGGMVSRGAAVPPALEFLPDARRVYEIVREAHRRAG